MLAWRICESPWRVVAEKVAGPVREAKPLELAQSSELPSAAAAAAGSPAKASLITFPPPAFAPSTSPPSTSVVTRRSRCHRRRTTRIYSCSSACCYDLLRLFPPNPHLPNSHTHTNTNTLRHTHASRSSSLPRDTISTNKDRLIKTGTHAFSTARTQPTSRLVCKSNTTGATLEGART